MTPALEEMFVVLDCETTGLDPAADEIVEIAAVATHVGGPVAMWTSFAKPSRPIPPEVSAVHGLTERDLRDALPLEEAIAGLLHFLALFTVPGDPPCLAAHNVEFDQQFLARASEFFTLQPHGAYPWLCTKRLAMHVYPDAPNHRNQTLRYFHDLKVDTLGLPPHRALADALVTAALLRHEIDTVNSADLPDLRRSAPGGYVTIDDVIAYAESPVELARMPFGKHRDTPMPDVPGDYIAWCLGPRGLTDMSRDLKFTLQRQLQLRRSKGTA